MLRASKEALYDSTSMAHSLKLGLILSQTTPKEVSDPDFVHGILGKRVRLRSGVGKYLNQNERFGYPY